MKLFCPAMSAANSADDYINSPELFNSNEKMIAQAFGKRKPGRIGLSGGHCC
ncbi:hypothetical protein PQ469_25460 [Mucilaginibacter sp. KACC 22773]|uniref:hypothetical protein n=1 Tax=Mucilaginibacter sp. KACC 22773 TaxID=3025671 RepID=UPI00236504E4|nr:hypothetical protein [Mucilaginibacter sp. KACC 22773]WDF77238.1 hypothetical protein PQ469_25460 [Mucilaginibacter sp. KACC 22773]